MRKKIVGMGLLVLLAACVTDPVTGRSKIGMPLSTEEEHSAGLNVREEMRKEFGVFRDKEVQEYLSSIVMKMTRRSARSDLQWDFTLLDDEVPNAFAAPGGQLFATTGLVEMIDNEAGFAVVMGHEIGHVEHLHVQQQLGRGALIGAAGELAPEYGDAVGIAGGLVLLNYSRGQELEADARGVRHAYDLGYDPRAGAGVFRAFLRMREGSSSTPSWLSSHPTDEERIENVMRLSAEVDPRLRQRGPVEDLRKSTSRWDEIVARIKRR